MKLNNRLFWKKSRFLTNCFSCFNAKKLVLVFFVGLFALSGLFAAEYVWTGGAGNTNWNDTGNWSGGGYPSVDGDIAVFNSEVSLNSISGIEDNATIYIRGSSNVVTFSPYQNTGNVNFLIKEGSKLRLSDGNFKSVSIEQGTEIEFAGQIEIKEDLINEGTVKVERGPVTVTGNIINKGTIDLGANTLSLRSNYSGEGTIKSSGGVFHADVENNVQVDYDPIKISKLVLGEGSNYSIYLQTKENREIHVLEKESPSDNEKIQIDNVTLPGGIYNEIALTNQNTAKLFFSGDATISGSINGNGKNVYVGENTLKFNSFNNLNVYVTNGSTLEYIGSNEDIVFNTLNYYEDGETVSPISIKSLNNKKIFVDNFTGNFSDLILQGSIQLGSNWVTLNVNNLVVEENSTVTIPNPVELNVNKNLENKGNLLLETTQKNITVNNFVNNGKVTQTGTLTINGDFVSGNSSSTYASVTLAPTSNEPVTVSGFGAINSLNAQNLGGKTIYFDGNITITGQNSNLKGSGNENENKLNIGGEGAITVKEKNSISTQYLNFLSSS